MLERTDWIDDRAAHFLWKKAAKAIRQFEMISDGDRVGVALSGGKDSFSLLAILLYGRRFFSGDFTVVALHVVGDARGAELPPHPELPAWLQERGIQHDVFPTYIAPDEELPCGCQRCTWNRRRTLFEMARNAGCNRLAFGHHLDDLAQTALLNLAYHGKNETMAPTRDYFDGEVTLIRPLCYTRESEIRRFSNLHGFPPPPSQCPRGEHSHRRRMKELLFELHRDCRTAEWNLVQSALKAMGCL